MKTNSLIFLLFVCLLSCDKNKKIITRFEDYQSYLSPAKHVSNDPASRRTEILGGKIEKEITTMKLL